MTEDERTKILLTAAEYLDDYAAVLNPRGDVGVIQLAMDVRKLADDA